MRKKRKREDTFWTVITIIVLTFLCYGFYATLSFVIHELKPQTIEEPDK